MLHLLKMGAVFKQLLYYMHMVSEDIKCLIKSDHSHIPFQQEQKSQRDRKSFQKYHCSFL